MTPENERKRPPDPSIVEPAPTRNEEGKGQQSSEPKGPVGERAPGEVVKGPVPWSEWSKEIREGWSWGKTAAEKQTGRASQERPTVEQKGGTSEQECEQKKCGQKKCEQKKCEQKSEQKTSAGGQHGGQRVAEVKKDEAKPAKGRKSKQAAARAKEDIKLKHEKQGAEEQSSAQEGTAERVKQAAEAKDVPPAGSSTPGDREMESDRFWVKMEDICRMSTPLLKRVPNPLWRVLHELGSLIEEGRAQWHGR